MYKYEKDVLNIEKAKKFNLEINKKKNPINTSISKATVNENKHNLINEYYNESYNDYSYLNNQAKLKDTCSSFIKDKKINQVNYDDYSNYRQNIIDYNSPEVLLQASYLNSLYAIPHIFSEQIDDDE